jgi:NADH-quinone oxidoreductase subunit J
VTLQVIAFWALAVASVASGMAVFIVDSMARATFALLASLLSVGLAFLLIDLEYLGVLVILMMVMEMLIMAVFMIMYMMNPAGLMPMKMVHNDRAAMVIAAGVFVLLALGAFVTPWPRRRGRPPADVTGALGLSIMGPKMLVMMVIGVAILATMISTVVLATHRGRYDRYGDALEARRPVDPGGGRLAVRDDRDRHGEDRYGDHSGGAQQPHPDHGPGPSSPGHGHDPSHGHGQ